MQKFIAKHQQDILGVLSGFDRIRFRGTIRMLACSRYLTALAEVDSKIPLGEVADAIRRPVLREKLSRRCGRARGPPHKGALSYYEVGFCPT